MHWVMAYTAVHPSAQRALDTWVPKVEMVDVAGSPLAYWSLIAALWTAGESFVLIEHDVEVTERAVAAMSTCGCDWGVSPYSGPNGSLLSGSLGFTGFGSRLLAAEPDALAEAGGIDDAGPAVPTRDWRRVDARLLGVLRNRGYSPHLHPAVLHHHIYDGRCACGGSCGETR